MGDGGDAAFVCPHLSLYTHAEESENEAENRLEVIAFGYCFSILTSRAGFHRGSWRRRPAGRRKNDRGCPQSMLFVQSIDMRRHRLALDRRVPFDETLGKVATHFVVRKVQATQARAGVIVLNGQVAGLKKQW